MDQNRSSALRSSLLVVGVPAVFVAFVVAAVPGLVLGALYGPGTYADAIAVTRVLAIVAGLSAFVSVLVHAGLARHHWTAWLPWAGATIEIVVIGLWHSSAEQIAAGSAAAGFVILVALVALEAPAWRKSVHA